MTAPERGYQASPTPDSDSASPTPRWESPLFGPYTWDHAGSGISTSLLSQKTDCRSAFRYLAAPHRQHRTLGRIAIDQTAFFGERLCRRRALLQQIARRVVRCHLLEKRARAAILAKALQLGLESLRDSGYIRAGCNAMPRWIESEPSPSSFLPLIVFPGLCNLMVIAGLLFDGK